MFTITTCNNAKLFFVCCILPIPQHVYKPEMIASIQEIYRHIWNHEGMVIRNSMSLEPIHSGTIPYSGKFSRVQVFAKIPFPLQKKFSRF